MLRILLLAASLAFSSTAFADTFNTTITGGGHTAFFPNVGGPSGYTYYPSISELYAVPLYVYIDGGPRTQGGLVYFLGQPATAPFLDLMLPVGPNGSNVTTPLYGPSNIGFVNGSGFYIFPGTYNFVDAAGDPFTYVVTTQTPTAPEIDPSLATAGLALLTGGIAVLRGRRVRHVS